MSLAACSKDQVDRIALISGAEGLRTINSVSKFQREARYAVSCVG